MMHQHFFVSAVASSRVVFSESAGLVAFVLLHAVGADIAWSALLGVSTTIALLLFSRRGWGAHRLPARLRDRGQGHPDRSRVMSFPFEHHRSIGVRWDGRRLSGTMEVTPTFGGTSAVARDACAPDVRLLLERLRDALAHHDLRPVSIDISSHGRRLGTDDRAADAYARLIGPLPAVAVRSTFVTVTVDVADTADAVARRGGGFDGASRTFTVALGRVERALSGTGVRTRLLTASEIAAVARYFAAGVRPGGPRRIQGWNLRGRDVDSAALEQLWSTPCAASTLTVKLRHSEFRDHVRLAASYTVTDDSRHDRPAVSRSIPTAMQWKGLLRSQEPSRTASDDASVPLDRVHHSFVDDLVLPVAGCGQLLGSDATGRAVCARLWGAGTSTVHVRGELFLARQLVFRAIAVGATALVSTERPAEWRHLAWSLEDPRSLTVTDPSERLTDSAARGFDLVVVDGHSSRPPSPSSSTMYLRDGPDGSMPDTADMSIVQPGCQGEEIAVTSRSGTEMLTLVTVGQETTFIGRPRLAVGLQRG
ncbi:type VII secretion protein EccE [Actinomycetes bacterium M1A6_2h]